MNPKSRDAKTQRTGKPSEGQYYRLAAFFSGEENPSGLVIGFITLRFRSQELKRRRIKTLS
jgi:hypothetical protein